MSRSCQRATSSSPAWRLPRSTRASPQSCSQRHGLRLCGIALEPFCVALPERLLAPRRTSVRWQVADLERRTPRRTRPPSRTRTGTRRGGRGRAPAWRARARARAARRRTPPPPGRCSSTCRRRRTASRPPRRRGPGAGARRSRRTWSAHSASLAPNVVGSAWMPCVRPTIGVSRNSRARAAIALLEGVDGVEQEIARPGRA